MYVVYSYVISKNPEEDAWQKLIDWAKPKGFFEDPGVNTTFGYNNPPPKNFESPRGEKYGYEVCLTVDKGIQPGEELQAKTLPGGLYVCIRVKGVWNIYKRWIFLNEWLAESEYELHEENEPGLEECITPFINEEEMLFDLYLPIKKK